MAGRNRSFRTAIRDDTLSPERSSEDRDSNFSIAVVQKDQLNNEDGSSGAGSSSEDSLLSASPQASSGSDSDSSAEGVPTPPTRLIHSLESFDLSNRNSSSRAPLCGKSTILLGSYTQKAINPVGFEIWSRSLSPNQLRDFVASQEVVEHPVRRSKRLQAQADAPVLDVQDTSLATASKHTSSCDNPVADQRPPEEALLSSSNNPESNSLSLSNSNDNSHFPLSASAPFAFSKTFWPPTYVDIYNAEVQAASSLLGRAQSNIQEQAIRQSEWNAERQREISRPETERQPSTEQFYDSDISDLDTFEDETQDTENSRIGLSEWSELEKELFFDALGKSRRDWPAIARCVQEARKDEPEKMKSMLECQQYAMLLDKELKVLQRERAMNLAYGRRRRKGLFGKRDIDIYADMLIARDLDPIVEQALEAGAKGLVRRLWKREHEAEVEAVGDLAIIGVDIASEVHEQAKAVAAAEKLAESNFDEELDAVRNGTDKGKALATEKPSTVWWKATDESDIETSILDQIPAARLLKLENMIRLSYRIFMNPHPDSDNVIDNWMTLVDELPPEMPPEPSMMFSCLSDFASIVHSLTVRFVKASMIQAEHRIRRGNYSIDGRSFERVRQVRRQDVRLAISQMGIKGLTKPSGQWFRRYWKGVPRRCGLRIEGKRGILGYDRVERKLSLKRTLTRTAEGAENQTISDHLEPRCEKFHTESASNGQAAASTGNLTASDPCQEPQEPVNKPANEKQRLEEIVKQREAEEAFRYQEMNELLIDEYVECRDEWVSWVEGKHIRESLHIVGAGESRPSSRPCSREGTIPRTSRPNSKSKRTAEVPIQPDTGGDVGASDDEANSGAENGTNPDANSSESAHPRPAISSTESQNDDDYMSDISDSLPQTREASPDADSSLQKLRVSYRQAVETGKRNWAARLGVRIRKARRVAPLPLHHPSRHTHTPSKTLVQIEDRIVPLDAARRIEWRDWSEVRKVSRAVVLGDGSVEATAGMDMDWMDKAEREASVAGSFDGADIRTSKMKK